MIGDETGSRNLRRGWTTGTCATVAARAAVHALWLGCFLSEVSIKLPRGQTARLPVHRTDAGDGWTLASVIKDAGDDPDVTHGAEIIVTVRQMPPGAGLSFKAGAGVGTVTREGLKLAVGEAAINPVPRAMITHEIEDLAKRAGRAVDLQVEIAVPGGEALAKETLNPRLGIVGGISILGTTGIVIPFSCSSWIHSIHRGIDVARAAKLTHLAAATGSTSEAAVQKFYNLPDMALLDMGDFAGGTLKYLRAHPVPKLTIAGGFGKLIKLAQGATDLHSRRSTLDREMLAQWLEPMAPPELVAMARQANTANQVLTEAIELDVPLAGFVAERARAQALELADDKLAIEVMIFNAQGQLLSRSDGWPASS